MSIDLRLMDYYFLSTMKYFLALFVPPLCVLFYIGIGAAILNLILCFFFWVPGVIHAIILLNKKERAESEARLIKTLVAGQQIQASQMQQLIKSDSSER